LSCLTPRDCTAPTSRTGCPAGAHRSWPEGAVSVPVLGPGMDRVPALISAAA
jgi:hypothetical protein